MVTIAIGVLGALMVTSERAIGMVRTSVTAVARLGLTITKLKADRILDQRSVASMSRRGLTPLPQQPTGILGPKELQTPNSPQAEGLVPTSQLLGEHLERRWRPGAWPAG